MLRFSVQQSFMIARSHYKNIDLAAMCQGFAPSYNVNELERIEEMAAVPARNLADKIEDEVVP
jgi:hypothetical protein